MRSQQQRVQMVAVGSQGWDELRRQKERARRRRYALVAIIAISACVGFWLGAL